jgi:site-specific DNA-cytosine methylase
MAPLTAVGAYIFAGGFTAGVKRAGFDVRAHLEGGPYGVTTAKLNWPDLAIHYPEHAWPLDEYRGVNFVYCNPTCAIFSAMGIRTTRGPDAWLTDPRVNCWYRSFALLPELRPDVLMIESVTQAYTTGRPMIDELTRRARALGYSVTHLLYDTIHFNIPQHRRRFFFIAHRAPKFLGLELDFHQPLPTVGEALSTITEPGEYHPQVELPFFTKWIGQVQQGERMSAVWMRCVPPESRVRNRFGGFIGRPGFNVKRLDLSKPSSAFIGNEFFHPTENRRLGANEMKAICGYPADFRLDGPARGFGSLLARAVMPPVGEWLGNAVARTINEIAVSDLGRSQTVTRVDLRKPGLAPVDLTAEYANTPVPDECLDPVRPSRQRECRTCQRPGCLRGWPPPASSTPRLRSPRGTVRQDTCVNDPSEVEPEPAMKLEQLELFEGTPPAPETASEEIARQGEGSGRLIQRLWLTGRYTPDDLVAVVHRNWTGRTTKVADVYHNYRVLLDAGTPNLPPWPSKKKGERGERNHSEAVAEGSGTHDAGLAAPSVGAGDDPPPRRAVHSVRVPRAEKTPPGEVTRGPERVERALLYLTNLPEINGRPDPISSHRVAWYLQRHLTFDAIWHQGNPGLALPKRVTELWAVASSWLHLVPPWRDFVQALYRAADRVIYCTNDYKGNVGSYQEGRLRDDAHYVTLSTVERMLDKRPGALINWNVLTYVPQASNGAARDPRLFYYGTLRPGRGRVFDRYFNALGDRLVISATKAREEKLYRERYPQAEVVGRLPNVFDGLARHRATLLFEDDYATRNYCSPPNRFYEALSTGTAMIFDPASIAMFARAGFDIRPYVALRPEQALELLDRADQIAVEQNSVWHRDYIAELDRQFHSVLPMIQSGMGGRVGPVPGLKRYEDVTYARVWES